MVYDDGISWNILNRWVSPVCSCINDGELLLTFPFNNESTAKTIDRNQSPAQHEPQPQAAPVAPQAPQAVGPSP